MRPVLGYLTKVREYAAFVGDTAAEYNIHEYEKYLLAIMMVETGGKEMIRCSHLETVVGQTEEKLLRNLSKAAVAYFAMLTQADSTLGCDLDAVIRHRMNRY